MSKFKSNDLVVGIKGSAYEHYPQLIVDTHTFPSGDPAYRVRSIMPQHDYDTGEEVFPGKDGYLNQSYVDKDFQVLWRKSE